jgi:hypothetical protein
MSKKAKKKAKKVAKQQNQQNQPTQTNQQPKKAKKEAKRVKTPEELKEKKMKRRKPREYYVHLFPTKRINLSDNHLAAEPKMTRPPRTRVKRKLEKDNDEDMKDSENKYIKKSRKGKGKTSADH